ncbi:MAG: DUF2974 domain-containing protein [Bacilli bacterium]|nr:DUF2974 domain-containing protein [Bacilli bacterium]
MASIIDYIKKYGNKSFEEEPLNEVDNALFSFLSYFNFDGIIDNSGRKVLLSDAIYQFFELHDPKVLRTHGIGLKDSYRLAKVLMEKKRYKDLPLYNYVYKTDEEVQFSSICIDLNDKLTYISIEGTDDEVVAWKEDFEMAYMFPVPAQKMCIDYLKNNVKFLSNKKYIIGGHSKGGNLALVGTMYLPFFKRMKVKSIWSFDGPGLNDEQINSKEYNRVKDKYHFYLPNYSIVGMMLNNRAEMNVVKASNVTIKSHSIYYWMTTDNKFTRGKLSPLSKAFDKMITKWIKANNKETIKAFIEDLFDIFDRCNIHDLCGLNARDIKQITTVARETKNISPESKERIKEFGKIVIDTFKEDAFALFKSKE